MCIPQSSQLSSSPAPLKIMIIHPNGHIKQSIERSIDRSVSPVSGDYFRNIIIKGIIDNNLQGKHAGDEGERVAAAVIRPRSPPPGPLIELLY